MKLISVIIKDIINTSYCADVADGEKIFLLLKKALGERKKVELSFEGTELVTVIFLNSAIGALFGEFDKAIIFDHLSIKGLTEDERVVWNKVVKGAIKYYDKERVYDGIFI